MSFIIKTKRLEIIPLNTSMLETTHIYATDLNVTKYMLFLPNKSIEETKSFLEYVEDCWNNNDLVANKTFECAIIYQGEHIGAVSLYIENEIAEMGWILRKEFQRLGIMYEAANALKNYCLNHYNIRKILAHCDVNNIASYKLMEKLGFERELVQERIYNDERGKSLEYEYQLVIRE